MPENENPVVYFGVAPDPDVPYCWRTEWRRADGDYGRAAFYVREDDPAEVQSRLTVMSTYATGLS